MSGRVGRVVVRVDEAGLEEERERCGCVSSFICFRQERSGRLRGRMVGVGGELEGTEGTSTSTLLQHAAGALAGAINTPNM
jgi:hypothetical protein